MTEPQQTEWEQIPAPDSLAVHRRGGAVRVTFDRPQVLNAFDSRLALAFRDLLSELSRDDTVRAVLLTGAGRGFSAGADVASQFGREEARAVIEKELREFTNATITLLREMPKPVVAAVNGPAAGMGCSIALACDLVLAAESAFFLLAFANLGLTTDGGASITVPARVGLGRAFSMALLAERVPARQAESWGLADRVHADDELLPAAEQLVLRLAAGPTLSYAATKRLINASSLAGLERQLDLEATLQAGLVGTSDFVAAAAAFGQRRAPTFEGR